MAQRAEPHQVIKALMSSEPSKEDWVSEVLKALELSDAQIEMLWSAAEVIAAHPAAVKGMFLKVLQTSLLERLGLEARKLQEDAKRRQQQMQAEKMLSMKR